MASGKKVVRILTPKTANTRQPAPSPIVKPMNQDGSGILRGSKNLGKGNKSKSYMR